MSVSIVNMGLWGRIPACVWVIELAICGEKKMATLATLWKANIEVCFVHQQLFRRRPDNLFQRLSGGVSAPQIGSLYNEAIRDSDARVWIGKDVVRTAESDHEQRTFFLLGAPSLKVHGCSVDPVVVIARCRGVMCLEQALCSRVCVSLPHVSGVGCRPPVGGHMVFRHGNVLQRHR